MLKHTIWRLCRIAYSQAYYNADLAVCQASAELLAKNCSRTVHLYRRAIVHTLVQTFMIVEAEHGLQSLCWPKIAIRSGIG